MERYWSQPDLQEIIISLLQTIAVVTTCEFSLCFNRFLPKILAVLNASSPPNIIIKVLQALLLFGTTIDPHLHLLVPAIVCHPGACS